MLMTTMTILIVKFGANKQRLTIKMDNVSVLLFKPKDPVNALN